MPFCPICKARLSYVLSNIKSPNEHRIRFYSCKRCTEKEKKLVTIILIHRNVPEKNYWKHIDTFVLAMAKN